jgi:O-antigen/teichoic acid export membrane protein
LRRAHRLALILKLALGVLASVVLLLLAPLLAHHFETPELATLLPILTVVVATDGLATTGRATLYGLQEFRWMGGLSVAFHVLKTIMVGALWGAKQGLIGLAVGLAALTALQALAATLVPWWILNRPARRGNAGEAEPFNRVLLRQIFAYCTPLLGARVAFLSGQNLSRVVLGKLFEPALLGYFSFAFQTVERFIDLVATVPAALMPALTHLVARREPERLRFVFDQAFRLIGVVACTLSLALFAFAPEMTVIVGSRMFEPSIPLLRILALVPIMRTAQQPLTMLFQAMRRPGVVLALALMKFATEFGCYFLLVPAVGLAGAGWANLAGATVSFAGGLWISGRLMPEGAGERARATGVGVALVMPLLALTLGLSRWLSPSASFVARLALAPIALVALFAVGLVTRYDLEKLASLPLKTGWSRRVRDRFVASADRLAQAVAPRRPA